MHVLFPKNHPLPDRKRRTLTTNKDSQQSIMLRIYQGESRMVLDNELLGTFVFSGIRPAPKGTVRVEVFFYIDSEGILNLSARDEETGHQVTTTLKVGKRKDTERSEPTRPRPQDAVDTLDTAPARPSPQPLSPLQMPAPSLSREVTRPAPTPVAKPAAPRAAASDAAAPRPRARVPSAPVDADTTLPATLSREEDRPRRPRPHRRPAPLDGTPREPRPAGSRPANPRPANPRPPNPRPASPADPDRPRRPRPDLGHFDQPAPPIEPPRLEPRPAPAVSSFGQRLTGWLKRLFGK